MNPDGLNPTDPIASKGPECPGDFEHEVAVDSTPSSTNSPRVVIEYRSRGLPWPFVLPLLFLVSLVAVAGYHRLVRRPFSHASAVPAVKVEGPVAIRPDLLATTQPGRLPTPPEPLSLSSQRMIAFEKPPPQDGPGEFVGPPSFKVADEKATPAGLEARAGLPGKQPPPLPSPKGATVEAVMKFGTLVAGPPASPVEGSSAPDETVPGVDKQPGGVAEKAETPIVSSKVPPLPQPLPTREEVLAEIQRESNRMKAERQGLKQLKEETPEILRRAYQAEVREQRPKFLAELRGLLRDKKSLAGPEIEQLHTRYIHEVDPKMRDEMRWLMKRISGRATPQGKITALRSLGLPEPAILDVVCNDLHHRAHSSRCRCFSPQMYVLAAREMIASDNATQVKQASNRGDTSKPTVGKVAGNSKQASAGNRQPARPQ